MSEESYWTRLQRRSVSRRTVLRGAALGGAGLAGAALIGCGGDDDDVTATGTPAVIEAGGVIEDVEGGTALEQEGAAERGEDFDWIFEDPPRNVPVEGGTRVSTYVEDAHFSPLHLGGLQTAHGFYDTFYTQFFRGDLPILFAGIETVERPDQLTNILTVRPGRIAPNEEGIDREVDAEDIFLTMRIQFDDLTVFSPGLYGRGTDWDQTQQVDARTISLILESPRNDFFRASNTPFAAKEMSQPHLSGEKTLQEWDHPIASGPYYRTAFTPGSVIETTRNPGYARAPWPFIENRKLVRITDQGQLEAQFRAGATYSFSAPSKIIFEDLLGDLGGGDRPSAYGVKSLNPAGGPTLEMRMTDGGLWADIRAREAATRAVDRQQFMDIIAQGEGVIAALWPQPFFEAWTLGPGDPEFDDHVRHDPQRTRELLDALRADGFDVDRKMNLSIIGTSGADELAILGKQQLEEAGFKIEIHPVPVAEISTRLLRRETADYDLLIFPTRTADPINGLRTYHSDPRGVNSSVSMSDPVLDAMIDDWEQTIEEDEIARKAKDLQRYLIAQWAPATTMYNAFSRVLYEITFRNINTANGSSGLFSWIDESYRAG